MILELQRFVEQSGKIEHKKEIFSIPVSSILFWTCSFVYIQEGSSVVLRENITKLYLVNGGIEIIDIPYRDFEKLYEEAKRRENR